MGFFGWGAGETLIMTRARLNCAVSQKPKQYVETYPFQWLFPARRCPRSRVLWSLLMRERPKTKIPAFRSKNGCFDTSLLHKKIWRILVLFHCRTKTNFWTSTGSEIMISQEAENVAAALLSWGSLQLSSAKYLSIYAKTISQPSSEMQLVTSPVNCCYC